MKQLTKKHKIMFVDYAIKRIEKHIKENSIESQFLCWLIIDWYRELHHIPSNDIGTFSIITSDDIIPRFPELKETFEKERKKTNKKYDTDYTSICFENNMDRLVFLKKFKKTLINKHLLTINN